MTRQLLFLDVMASLQILEEPQIRQFFLLTYTPTVKYASCWRKFCSKNCRPPLVIQAHIPHICDVVNGQLATVVTWAGFYMDVVVNLNAKHAIMCRKTVFLRMMRNRHIWVFGNTFTYNSDIFNGTSETMMLKPLNICNHNMWQNHYFCLGFNNFYALCDS